MTYKFAVTEVCYGCISVEADSEEEARELASSMDGDYFVNKSDVEVEELIEVL